MPPALSPQVFAITSHLIEERTGLHYEPADAELLGDRLAVRAAELGLGSLLDYYYFLRYDEQGNAELQTLVESLVVHETYFFREQESMSVLVEDVLPQLLATRPQVGVGARGRARVWSAACASGEEPYTLALMLAASGLLEKVDIVATDISDRVLARAQAGVYAGRSLRALPDAARLPPQLEAVAGGVRVSQDVRTRIVWRRVNLIDRDAVRALGSFDAILCRNVLIYFTDATISGVAESLHGALRPEGVLVVGASESLLRFGTLFECEERGNCFFYRRSQ